MGTWYVDTTAVGDNNGISRDNAWTNIRSAFENATYSAGDIIYVRRNQTHTMTNAHCNVGDSGSFGNPIRIIGDNDTLNIWADAGNVRPILDWGAFARYLYWQNKDFWQVENLEISNGETMQVYLSQGNQIEFINCTFSDSGQTPSMSIYAYNATGLRCIDCTFAATVQYGIQAKRGASAEIRGCTFDDATILTGYAIAAFSSMMTLENVVFGGTTQNDYDFYGATCIVRARNVTFNGGTGDINFGTNSDFWDYIAIEDYDGTKGAWHKEYCHGVLDSFAASSTVAGQRSGGAVTVVKVVAASAVSEYAPLLAHEQVINVTSGSKTVDVWIQPNGWASVPDTEGSDADIWVEVAAWDTGNGEYLYFDSRDEGSQDTQVNDEWHKIRVTGVAADAAGNIVVRVWQITGDGADIVYADPHIEIDGTAVTQAPIFALDQIVEDDTITAADYPAEADVESGVAYDSGNKTGTLAVPAEADVQQGVGYGDGGTEFTGDFRSPAVGDVEDGVGYGAAGTEYEGTLAVPAAGDVESGVSYGAAGTEHTGTLAVPAEDDVEDGVGYGAAGTEHEGNFEAPAESDVRDGTGYGANGTEHEGSLSVAVPGTAVPTVSLSVDDPSVTVEDT